MKRTLKLLCCVSLLASSSYISNAKDPDITIVTSNKKLEQAFSWAKVKARSYVLTGKRGVVNASEQSKGDGDVAYIPSYWAGYPHRTAFYSRDYCHQMSGAHLLGLQKENYVMLRSFARTANASRKWYPLWAINFDGSDYTLDYRNDNSFVREVPAVFELVEKGYRQYLWTGNDSLISDPVLWSYYSKAVTDFVALHDMRLPNGVAEGDGSGSIFRGTASFNEADDVPFLEAGDGIACQYQAFLSYARMLKARGDANGAAIYLKKAADLKSYFNTQWSKASGADGYVRGYNAEGKPVLGFGKENSWFMPMKLITEPSKKNDAYLDYISQSLADSAQCPPNVEALTYLPDTYFAYNRVKEGWYWMERIIDGCNQSHVVSQGGRNGDYPEVSFVIISGVVENLMGVEPNAPRHSMATVSRLPAEVSTLGVKNIPMGDHLVNVLHEGRNTTTVTHVKGLCSLSCELRFYGRHSQIVVNGKTQAAKISHLNGVEVSSVVVKIGIGQKVCAKL